VNRAIPQTQGNQGSGDTPEGVAQVITKHRSASLLVFSFSLVLASTFCQLDLLAQDNVEVNSADPNNAPQGTTSLNVIISGKHFERGHQAKLYVSGTTNPGGITVNSTTFINPTQLVANISVAGGATVSKFDVVVALASGGRTGKGIELFAVVKKGTKSTCTLAPLSSAFTLVGLLNPTGAYSGGGFGVSVRAAKIILGSQDVRIVVVGVGQKARLEVFFLDATTGQVLDGTVIGTNTQPHLTIQLPSGAFRDLAFGDFNADGILDIVALAGNAGQAFAVLGVIQNGVFGVTSAIPVLMAGPGTGASVAAGDLDGNPGDEIAIGVIGGGTGSKTQNGWVDIFKFYAGANPSFTLLRIITSPLPNPPSGSGSDLFGAGVAIADVADFAAPDLVVSAPNSFVGLTVPGRVFALNGYSLTSNEALATPGPTSYWAAAAAAGNVDGNYNDVVGIAGTSARVFSGLVTSGQPPTYALPSVASLNGSYGNDLSVGDLNADTFAEVLVGAPNSGVCSPNDNAGVAYVYSPVGTDLSQPPDAYLLEAPSLDPNFGGYGFSMAAVPDSRLFLVGENGRDINGTPTGQVYVYRMN